MRNKKTSPPKKKSPAVAKAGAVSLFDPYKWWKDKKTLLMIALLLAVTFVVFFPSLKGEFLNWDDDVNIYLNENVKQLNTENVKKIFSETVIGNYNPLTILSFALEYHFFGEDTFYYHLHNIILHLLNAFFVFWLLMLLRLPRGWALFAAFLFAVHPMRVESVAWITERKDVLFAFFYLAAALSYVYHLKFKKKRYIALLVLFFMLSLLSKIQAVSLPLALLLIDYLLKRPLKFRLIIEKIPYFLLSLAVGLLGVYFLGKQESLDNIEYSIAERAMLGTHALWVYLAKSVVPYSMSAIYPFPKPGAFEWYFYVSPFILIAIAVLVFLSARKTRAVVFGALFFLFNIMFILQIVSAGQGYLADRFTYIPYIGLAYVYAYGFMRLGEKRKTLLPVLAGIAGLIIAFYGVFSFVRVGVWINTETLFTDVIKYDPKIATAYRNRGNYYRDNDMKDKALADFAALVQLTPDDHKPYISRGKIYFDTGEMEKAFFDFNKSIELDSSSAEAFSNRGTIYASRGEWDLALYDFNSALRINPGWKDAFLNRGLLYYNLMRWQDAIADIDQYLSIAPGHAGAYNLRALAKAQMRDFPGALHDYELAMQSSPDEGVFYQNRALLYSLMGEKTKALADVEKARQKGIHPDPAFVERLRN
jgi:protein O-mannosyl-transferase